MALRLAQAGHRVAVNYAHDEQGAGRTVQAILAAGGSAHAFRFDVTDEAQVLAGLQAVRALLGPVRVLVNNATGPQPTRTIEQQSWQDHLDQLSFFVKAPLLLLQATLPDLRASGSGRVINIGSEVVDLGNPDMAPYVSAKSALVGLTRSWARALGSAAITVNLVAPGWIPVERHAEEDPAAFEGYRSGVALGRMGLPGEVASIVAYLASNEASFITGQTLAVNGGNTLT